MPWSFFSFSICFILLLFYSFIILIFLLLLHSMYFYKVGESPTHRQITSNGISQIGVGAE